MLGHTASGWDPVHAPVSPKQQADVVNLGFVLTVIDHTTGTEHQLLFFKERFLPKDHPDRSKMDRFGAKLRKLGLREETIGYGPSKEKWEAWNRSPQ